MIALCVLFPLLSKLYVDPLVAEEFGSYREVLPTSLMYTLVLIIIFVFAVPLIAYKIGSRQRVDIRLSYMNGVNAGDNNQFTDSFGNPKMLWLSNYYFHRKIGQRKLMRVSQLFTLAFIVVMLCVIIGGAI